MRIQDGKIMRTEADIEKIALDLLDKKIFVSIMMAEVDREHMLSAVFQPLKKMNDSVFIETVAFFEYTNTFNGEMIKSNLTGNEYPSFTTMQKLNQPELTLLHKKVEIIADERERVELEREAKETV